MEVWLKVWLDFLDSSIYGTKEVLHRVARLAAAYEVCHVENMVFAVHDDQCEQRKLQRQISACQIVGVPPG